MLQRCVQFLTLAILAGLLGSLAPAPLAHAEPLDSQANSLQSAVDSFLAHLKTETNEAMNAAARAARENKDTLDAAKARIGASIAAIGETLSGQKARLKTFGKDAAAISEAWREAAVLSWAKIERSARDALDWIEAWMRNQSLPDKSPEIHV